MRLSDIPPPVICLKAAEKKKKRKKEKKEKKEKSTNKYRSMFVSENETIYA